ncbi:MAG: hypothetical protein DRQ55_01090 [Planctomycetota bacterium]|nr:MAG: hypothetical protein DRQ55_01090 [Planctomycetota bacterium]
MPTAPPLAIVLSLALSLGLSSCGPDRSPYDPSVLAASIPDVVAALEAGDAEGALALIEVHRVSGTAPEGIWHYEGVALMDAGRSADALETLGHELGARPGNGQAQLIMAEALLDLGRAQQALPHLERARALLPSLPYVELVSARVALAREDDRGAAAGFTGYLKHDAWSPRAAEAHHGLAQLARAAGTLGVADRHEALSAQIERAQQVLNAQRQRLALDPSDSTAALGVGMVYLSLHNEVVSDPRLLSRAAEAFAACLESDPDNLRALYNLGFVAMVQGRTQQAAMLWKRTVALDPEHAGALLNGGLLAAREHDLAPALELLERALTHSEDPGEAVRAHRALEQVLREMGQEKRAEIHAQAARDLAPAAADPGSPGH